jgi:hypothetical protein
MRATTPKQTFVPRQAGFWVVDTHYLCWLIKNIVAETIQLFIKINSNTESLTGLSYTFSIITSFPWETFIIFFFRSEIWGGGRMASFAFRSIFSLRQSEGYILIEDKQNYLNSDCGKSTPEEQDKKHIHTIEGKSKREKDKQKKQNEINELVENFIPAIRQMYVHNRSVIGWIKCCHILYTHTLTKRKLFTFI